MNESFSRIYNGDGKGGRGFANAEERLYLCIYIYIYIYISLSLSPSIYIYIYVYIVVPSNIWRRSVAINGSPQVYATRYGARKTQSLFVPIRSIRKQRNSVFISTRISPSFGTSKNSHAGVCLPNVLSTRALNHSSCQSKRKMSNRLKT